MLAIQIELLAGRYVCSAYNDREQVEWPPHPARLFSALVATWAEGTQAQDEALALQALEQLDPPRILASSRLAIGRRDVAPVFVPVNDASVVASPSSEKLDTAIKALSGASEEKARAKLAKEVDRHSAKLRDDTERAIAVPQKFGKEDASRASRVLPECRGRQPRTFPSATPDCARFAFVWTDAELAEIQSLGLDALLRRLVRLGHSSTFVFARRVDADSLAALAGITTLYRPDDRDGSLSIRWIHPGQLERLQEAFLQHAETEPRVLPARFVRYTEGDVPTQTSYDVSVFEPDYLVFARTGGPRLPITSVVGVARQLRRALMKAGAQPPPELLSGHKVDGSPSERAHLAIVPLANVGHEHADGALMGIALILPRDGTPEEREAVLRAIASLELAGGFAAVGEPPVIRLLLGAAGELELERVAWGEPRRRTLRSATWCRPSRSWASVTPVALDRNPGDLHDKDPTRRAKAFEVASEVIRDALGRVVPGIATSTVQIEVTRSCVVNGTAKPRNFPRYPVEQTRPQRVLVHVRLVFDVPVRGPLLLGAGRYHGLGLCLPVADDRTSQLHGEATQ